MFLCAEKQSSALFADVMWCNVCDDDEVMMMMIVMYDELQPGQVNLYATFDWLNGGILSWVFVKKRNFVVFCLFYSGRRDISEARLPSKRFREVGEQRKTKEERYFARAQATRKLTFKFLNNGKLC